MANDLSLESLIYGYKVGERPTIFCPASMRNVVRRALSISSEDCDIAIDDIKRSIMGDNVAIRTAESARSIAVQMMATAKRGGESADVMTIVGGFARSMEAEGSEKNFFQKVWAAIKRIFQKIVLFFSFVIKKIATFIRGKIAKFESKMFANKDKILSLLKTKDFVDSKLKIKCGGVTTPFAKGVGKIATDKIKSFTKAADAFSKKSEATYAALTPIKVREVKKGLPGMIGGLLNGINALHSAKKMDGTLSSGKSVSKTLGGDTMVFQGKATNMLFYGVEKPKTEEVLISKIATADNIDMLSEKYLTELKSIMKTATEGTKASSKAIKKCEEYAKTQIKENDRTPEIKIADRAILDIMRELKDFNNIVPHVCMNLFHKTLDVRSSIYRACKKVIGMDKKGSKEQQKKDKKSNTKKK